MQRFNRHTVRTLSWLLAAVPALLLTAGCDTDRRVEVPNSEPRTTTVTDPHSFSTPESLTLRHLVLDLAVDFDSQTLAGTATLHFDPNEAQEVILDTRDLTIEAVVDGTGRALEFTLDPPIEPLGSRLAIQLHDPGAEQLVVSYRTSPGAEALQWLGPEQTSGERPFLFSQSQAILARTWVPLQDTPSVRFTYEAEVRVPVGLMALMSAINPQEPTTDGVYRFEMPQPIPSYLLALAVGDLRFAPLGSRSGVYAEPSVLERAAWEFAELERMIEVTEELYGAYPWGRYDLLVLPPSFPFGGMENPRLTFLTPTILAGDRSLVSLVAHELAHSWSGNLVTNRTWDDFWLNEGFTTYIERRIMEALVDRDYEEMLAVLGLQDLREEIVDLGENSPDTHLVLDLSGRNPDDGMTNIAYEKGALLLRTLEEAVGREAWDEFIVRYFTHYGFRSVSTLEFKAFLDQYLPGAAGKVNLMAWLHEPGIPKLAALPESPEFTRVDQLRQRWLAGEPIDWSVVAEDWTTHHWLHFLRAGLGHFDAAQLAALDRDLAFTDSGNAEILAAWLQLAIRSNYRPADDALESFLLRVGRRKFLTPIYRELARTPEGKQRALAIYQLARSGYHAISVATIDELLGVGAGAEGVGQ